MRKKLLLTLTSVVTCIAPVATVSCKLSEYKKDPFEETAYKLFKNVQKFISISKTPVNVRFYKLMQNFDVLLSQLNQKMEGEQIDIKEWILSQYSNHGAKMINEVVFGAAKYVGLNINDINCINENSVLTITNNIYEKLINEKPNHLWEFYTGQEEKAINELNNLLAEYEIGIKVDPNNVEKDSMWKAIKKCIITFRRSFIDESTRQNRKDFNEKAQLSNRTEFINFLNINLSATIEFAKKLGMENDFYNFNKTHEEFVSFVINYFQGILKSKYKSGLLYKQF